MGHGSSSDALTAAALAAFKVFVDKGKIDVVGDFPSIGVAQNTWVYEVTSALTDPVTGNSFSAGDIIAWDGTKWLLLGGSVTGTSLRAVGPIAIAPGATATLDALNLARRFAVYHLLIDQPLAPKLTKVTVDLVSDGIDPVHTCPSEAGDIQTYTTDSIVHAGFVKLQVTNNETNPITVSGKVIE